MVYFFDDEVIVKFNVVGTVRTLRRHIAPGGENRIDSCEMCCADMAVATYKFIAIAAARCGSLRIPPRDEGALVLRIVRNKIEPHTFGTSFFAQPTKKNSSALMRLFDEVETARDVLLMTPLIATGTALHHSATERKREMHHTI